MERPTVIRHRGGVRTSGEVWVRNRLWRIEPRLCFSKVQLPDGPASRETGEFIRRDWDLAVRETTLLDTHSQMSRYGLGSSPWHLSRHHISPAFRSVWVRLSR